MTVPDRARRPEAAPSRRAADALSPRREPPRPGRHTPTPFGRGTRAPGRGRGRRGSRASRRRGRPAGTRSRQAPRDEQSLRAPSTRLACDHERLLVHLTSGSLPVAVRHEDRAAGVERDREVRGLARAVGPDRALLEARGRAGQIAAIVRDRTEDAQRAEQFGLLARRLDQRASLLGPRLCEIELTAPPVEGGGHLATPARGSAVVQSRRRDARRPVAPSA